MTDPALPAGVITPLVSFLTESGKPDREAMSALVEQQIAAGVNGLLATGSTGEVGNLTPAERSAVLRVVVDEADGRLPVWAGVGGLGTSDTVQAARDAEAGGADALLVLPPLFFDSSDAELAAHFRAVATAVELPVVAYDVPPRTPRKLPVSLVSRLAADGVLAGVKDSSGDLTAGRQLCAATADVTGFRTYAGVEITLDVAIMLGFHGIVPGFANVLPGAAVETYAAARAGDVDGAAAAQATYLRLLRILDVPLDGAGFPARAVGAIKVATATALGLPVPSVAPPLTPPDDAFVRAVSAIVKESR
ncbi:dihydrodipicolinate synthase family protein [Jiangella anatolica]|uniref:Dihydrodipicolinate synthase family protein n=1 Tax=Jiangella anatolica TaxID=2670374 RepID=A0A2W2C1S9_9ACTN|nr:dihydrodipicolinate synthase family protein [Jiangella anatolica]PZF86684.1 dihydrodipicolinate synthase family protein [Jiangella anatolica]